MIQMSPIVVDGLLSTMPASEYNITCVCCSGKSGIIHMIPIFNNNDIEFFVTDIPEIKISYSKYFIHILCQCSLHVQNMKGACTNF